MSSDSILSFTSFCLGYYFFENANSCGAANKTYATLQCLESLVTALNEDQSENVYFEQEGSTAHSAEYKIFTGDFFQIFLILEIVFGPLGLLNCLFVIVYTFAIS